MGLILIGSVAFVAVGLWLVGPSMSTRVSTPLRVLVGGGVPFFGIAGIYAGHRLYRRYPLLVADSSGIVDSGSATAAGYIGWEEIDRLTVYRFAGQWMLGIWPRDLERLLNRQHWWKRRMMKMNVALGAAPANIPEAALPIRAAELAELLHSRFRGGGR
jgi:hypothetical protein